MLVCSLLFALALLFGCERRSRTIHAASWKPWLMGTDRLVVRSAPAPGHGKNRGFPAALQHPRLPHCSQSCGRAREPQPRRPWQPAASWGPVRASPKPCVCLLVCLPVYRPVRAPLPAPLPPPRKCRSALPSRPRRGKARNGPGGGRGSSARSALAAVPGAGPEALPSHPRPSRGHLRESLDELGGRGPPFPPEEQRA